jgi:protein-disulfide isomerase
MTFRSPLCLLAAVLAGALVTGARATETVTPAQKELVEQIVHDYILQHPELLTQALQSAEDKRKAQVAESNHAAVVEKRQALRDDPVSLVAGNVTGDVTIVEFFDYRCGYCKQVEPALDALLREDRGLRIIYKELPILGKDSLYATRVALAARKQEKYEKFHAVMMAAKGQIDERTILDVAAAAGLDIDQVKADLQVPEIDDAIERNLALAQTLGIRGTPGFVIGDEIVFGAIDIATMRQKIAAARRSESRPPESWPSGEAVGVAAPRRPALPPRQDWRG